MNVIFTSQVREATVIQRYLDRFAIIGNGWITCSADGLKHK